MDIRQVEIFRAVALAGGFTRAAHALQVGQPSLTRSVARLEASLGFLLFTRGHGAARLTPEGEAFLREVENSFTGLEHLRVAAQDIRSFGAGRLRILAAAALSESFTAHALKALLARYPKVTISLQVRHSSAVYEGVAARRADIGLAVPRRGPFAVEEIPLLDLSAVLIMPVGHHLAHLRRPLTPADLKGEAFLAQSHEEVHRHVAESAFSAAGIVPRRVIETANSGTLCALVAAGLGVALVNPIVAEQYRKSGLIIRRFRPAISFTYTLLRPKASPANRLVDEFQTLLLAAAQEAMGGGVQGQGKHP